MDVESGGILFSYDLKTGENGYWERRERNDWKGVPRIFDAD